MGYFGGIVALLAVYLGLIVGDGGLLGVSTEDGFNIRLVALVAAVWFAVFAVPMLLMIPETPPAEHRARLGVAGSYRKLIHDLRSLYHANPHTVYFLGASAIFRDGLAAIFTFGAVLAVTVYGIDPADVLIFGVAANVVSAIGALVAGRIDDRVGPKAVIVWSLVGMLVSGGILLFVSGPTPFWIFGLGLTLFVGPAQASSRTYLALLTPPGREGQMFGLYATTGRAVSFLAPTLVGCSPRSTSRTGPGSSGSCWSSGPGSSRCCRCVRRSGPARRSDPALGPNSAADAWAVSGTWTFARAQQRVTRNRQSCEQTVKWR